MNGRQRMALEDLVRSAVASDLDVLHGEITRLRREVTTLERMVGLPGEAPDRRARQARSPSSARAAIRRGRSRRCCTPIAGR